MNPEAVARTESPPPTVTRLEVSFPGGKRVSTQVGRHVISTDQSVRHGGDDSAPAPFDLFLASIATCAGAYALGFCHARDLSTEGLKITQEVVDDPATHLPAEIRFVVSVPTGFPEKYRPGLLRAVESCKVKKTLALLPRFSVELG